MTLGGPSVWTNFSYCSSSDTPCGCLLNPEGSHLILFDKYKKSKKSNLKVFTHLYYVNHLGEPNGLKNTRLLDLNCAKETWDELVNNGWIEVKNNFFKKYN